MFLVAILAFFGNAIQYQNTFDVCEKYDFKIKECKFHERMVKANPKSKHYK